MRIHLIAVHYSKDRKKILGFRLLDSTSGQVMDVSYGSAFNNVKAGRVVIKGICLQGNELKGDNGVLDRYAKVVDQKLYGNPAIVILYEMGDLGYAVSDFRGNIKKYRTADVITLANKFGLANGKVVRQEGKDIFISAINGSYDRVEIEDIKNRSNTEKPKPAKREKRGEQEVEKRVPPKVEKKEEKKDEKKDERVGKQPPVTKPNMGTGRSLMSAPRVTGRPMKESMLDEIDPVSGMTVGQKMTQATLILRNTKPFYYAVLYNLKKVETLETPTMGVSVDTLYYNPEFVRDLPTQELVFVLMHEVLHITMQHTLRQGIRRHMLWNVACDYYINRLLSEELQVTPDSGATRLAGDHFNVGVKFVTGGLFNSNVSVEDDTPEKIYEEILNEMLESAQGSGDSQGSSDGDGSGGYNIPGVPMDGDGEGKDSGEHGNSTGSGEEEGQETGKKEENIKGREEGKGSEKDGEGNLEDTEFRGKKVGQVRIVDILEDDAAKKLSDVQKAAKGKAVLERAVVLRKQLGAYSKGTEGYLERIIEEALAPRVNWRSLLRNKLTKARMKVNTYSRPDRRFLSRGMTLPGPKELENDSLENVKVCIDTSGSVTDKELGMALKQVQQLLSNFKAEAELLYWDTEVRAVYEFKNTRELLEGKPKGGGGTDANCVFEYFESGEYAKLKKPKPSIIIMFTDGYFGHIDDKYKKYRDTIWVIKNNDNFVPPFGVKAKLFEE